MRTGFVALACFGYLISFVLLLHAVCADVDPGFARLVVSFRCCRFWLVVVRQYLVLTRDRALLTISQ